MAKEKQKDPAFLMYPQDFIVGCIFMTNTQVGAYIRLLCLQHQKGELTYDQIMQVCEGIEEDAQVVISKFTQIKQGKFVNIRLKTEMERRKSKAMKNSANAKKRWDKSRNANAQHSALEDEDVSEDVNGFTIDSLEDLYEN